MKLEELRREIDSIDEQIAGLFERRMGVSKGVALAKIEADMPVFDGTREKQVLESRTKMLENAELKPYFETFLQAMMDVSKSYQTEFIPAKNMKTHQYRGVCAYQGIQGAYGEEAVYGFFGEDCETLPCNSFEEVVNAVSAGKCDYGILPIENSSAGSIDKTYDVLKNVWVVGEYTLEVKHVLASLGTLEDITRVFSHEQGFLQCEKFLANHPTWLKTPYFNTAIAAKFVSESGDKKNAVIASSHAAKTYDFNILKTDINDIARNYTRFVAISAHPSQSSQKGRGFASIILSHEKGALLNALKCFAGEGYNLTHIKSRPIANAPFTYKFYVEFEGDCSKVATDKLMGELAKMCTPVLLGRF